MLQEGSGGPLATQIPSRSSLVMWALLHGHCCTGAARSDVQHMLRHGKIVALALECFSPEFFFFCLLRLRYSLGVFVTWVHGRSQKSSSFRMCHQVTPSLTLAVGQALPMLLHPGEG